jgi:hypothetical protein
VHNVPNTAIICIASPGQDAEKEGGSVADQKPIERTFPISEVNRIAEREAHAKRYYRPVYTMHMWWARWLGSVFRTIALVLEDGSESTLEFEESLLRVV